MKNTKCLIYARVSTHRQVEEGHGWESQEHRGRSYANMQGYTVAKVFVDKATGGAVFERQAFSDLVTYLKVNRKEKFVVIFDDIKRLARDVVVYFQLKKQLTDLGATIECLNFKYEDTPEGKFLEAIIAAQAQLEREQNKRQVKQKMKARLEKGFWCFFPPSGYEFYKNPIHGKLLRPKRKQSKLIKEALEGYAHGRFNTLIELARFLEANNYDNRPKIHKSVITRLVREPLYAGYLEYPKWSVGLRKAKHKSIITLDTYLKIQKKIRTPESKSKSRQNVTFPLRGLLYCKCCDKRLTSSSPKGKSGKHFHFYTCNNSKCSAKPKYLLKEYLESRYLELLKKVKPEPQFLSQLEVELQKEFNKRMERNRSSTTARLSKISQKEKQLDTLIDQMSLHSTPAIQRRFHAKINQLQAELESLNSKSSQRKEQNYPALLGKIKPLLLNPAKFWSRANYSAKSKLHQIIFNKPISYIENEGFGTPETTLLFSLKEAFEPYGFRMVQMPEDLRNSIYQEIERVANV